MNDSRVKTGLKSSWSLTADAWDGFLRWLDDGTDSGGQSYMEMRRRLVAYFDRKNCRNPDDLADETLDRVARRLKEEKTIETETPAKYWYTVARFVFMESLRSKDTKSDPIDELSRPDELRVADGGDQDERDEKEKMLNCLDKCSGELETKNRDLIFRYYAGEERVKIENRRSRRFSVFVTPFVIPDRRMCGTKREISIKRSCSRFAQWRGTLGTF